MADDDGYNEDEEMEDVDLEQFTTVVAFCERCLCVVTRGHYVVRIDNLRVVATDLECHVRDQQQ